MGSLAATRWLRTALRLPLRAEIIIDPWLIIDESDNA